MIELRDCMVERLPDKKLSYSFLLHRVIQVERIKQMQQVSLRCAETASQQVSGDDRIRGFIPSRVDEAGGRPNRTGKLWKLRLLGCRVRLLVLREDVRLVTVHTRLAFHERISLQLRHLIGVTGFACA
jgi:hypothetical protein